MTRPTIVRRLIDPTTIPAQREAGWPDFHPERYCHRCGVENPTWFADAPTWARISKAYLGEETHAGIVCPLCAYELCGREGIWQWSRWTPDNPD